jgi:hypothetical protein
VEIKENDITNQNKETPSSAAHKKNDERNEHGMLATSPEARKSFYHNAAT